MKLATIGTFLAALLLGICEVNAQALVGDWRLVSFQTVIDGEPPKDLYGAKPRGQLSISSTGRLIVLITGETRVAGAGDAERAALHKTMIAYTGDVKATGKEFVTKVDTSWNEAWNGTEQRRFFTLEGDTLKIDTAPQPSTLFPGKTSVSRLVWERMKP